MKIYGLQKLSLLDFPDKMSCTVFTGGCNFRCPFCHNSALVDGQRPQIIGEDAFFDFLKSRVGLLDGVCVTGGEPLLNGDIDVFFKKIKASGYAVKLDTNGSFPDLLKALAGQNLIDYVAMDIKNSPENYSKSAGAPCDTDKIKESAAYLMNGSLPFEFRTTMVKEFNTLKDAEIIGKWLEGGEKYFLQYFRPSENTIMQGFHPLTDGEMNEALNILKKYIPDTRIRGA
ncbi:MAG: anaerobic ribonucleoside-triphosphate reductase activating protein [Clostridiales bacterium]|jgi:pyruvate formate lyase activating enzyme|nr:anaerobic ribonucleoside-triphosphate reductase activating protein [Clostridiales bacterium]